MDDYCLVCYMNSVEETCPDCHKPMCTCEECAADMGENYCAHCDLTVDPNRDRDAEPA